MKKLSLRLDDLRVDTFETATPEASRGTVLGHTDRYTDCWGLCGVNSIDGGIACGPSYENCTWDPNAAECRSNFYDTRCVQTNCNGVTCNGASYCT